MDFYRIGDKLISIQKLNRLVGKVFELRTRGFPQQEVAQRMGIDRSFISRLETLGEIRKGQKLAVIGFPVENKEEIEEISDEMGIDFVFVLNNSERWQFVQKGSSIDFFNKVMQILTMLKEFDTLVLITSDKWLKVAEALFDRELVFWELGPSPIEEDCYVDSARYKDLIARLL